MSQRDSQPTHVVTVSEKVGDEKWWSTIVGAAWADTNNDGRPVMNCRIREGISVSGTFSIRPVAPKEAD